MNAKKAFTRLIHILPRILAVIILVSAAIPAAPLSAASASSPRFEIPDFSAVATVDTPRLIQIAIGTYHSCALTPAGGVVCWGTNYSGELGDGTTNQSPFPVAVHGLNSGVISLALADSRSCALTTFGQVYCWGHSAMDISYTTTPVEIAGLGRQVIQLAAGPQHTCALTASGKVLCWGTNMYGNLGNGTFTDSLTPVTAIAAGATQISIGLLTTCALMTSGEVYCWGDGRWGQLGDGVWVPQGGVHKSNIPLRVRLVGGSPLAGASQVGVGVFFACALLGGAVDCWGHNTWGQLGSGVTGEGQARAYASPVLTSAGGAALSEADQLNVGIAHSCVHLSNGRLKCWGLNAGGQLGNGSSGGGVFSEYPTTVLNPAGTAPFEGATQLAAGDHTCAFTSWEAVSPYYCWGYNFLGQLGIGSGSGQEPLPRPVASLYALSGGGGGGGGGLGVQHQIVAGGAHTCSVTTGGGLKCWGSNTHGQLGDGSTTDRLDPVNVAGLSSDVASLALGENFTCAIISWGRLKCWGENTHGQLGNATKTDSPLPVTAILPGVIVRQVVTGAGHTCILTQPGGVQCWGDNSYGQLGDGTTTESTSPVTVTLGSSAVWIAAGGSTSCAVLSGGQVKCWGLGDYGQLGDASSGSGHYRSTAADVQVAAGGLLAGATQLALGSNFACALQESGQVDCWGKNDWGQLGQGTSSPALWSYAKPVLAELGGSPLQGATQVTAGGAHACARLYTGRLKCWGQGEVGQLGLGTTGPDAHSALPLTVIDHYQPYAGSIPYLEGVSQVSAGGVHTCAFIKWNGSPPYKCWGGNSSGQLGDGDGSRARQSGLRIPTADRPYPTIVADFLKFGSPPLAKIASGGSFTCALTQAGGVKCWGSNYYGQLGDGTNTDSNTPVGVVGLSSGVVGLAGGGGHACALTSAGGVKCWGYGNFGQLGDDSWTSRNSPVDVFGLNSGVVEVVAGDNNTCALTSTGIVMCWGLINGTGTVSTPYAEPGMFGMIGLAAGRSHVCALNASGGLKCLGNNSYGQLGDGTNINGIKDVSGLAGGVVDLGAGDYHTCALLSSGGVKCWGLNADGQLGNSTNTDSNIPVDVSNLGSDIIGLSVSYSHNCALTTSGGVKCWGSNENGQLGNNTNQDSNSPVDVSGLASGVTSLSAGARHTCAVLAGTGPLRCWGDNSNGQLGIGVATEPEDLDTKGPVVSKWLTADGLVEDEKGEVLILPHPNTVLVIPPQPVITPTLVTASEVITPPTPCTSCSVLPGAPVVNVTVSTHVLLHVHWVIRIPNWPQSNRLLSAASEEQSLNLYHYVNGTWVPLLPCTGCSLDTTNHVLTAPLDGPGMYALMVQTLSFVYLPLVRR